MHWATKAGAAFLLATGLCGLLTCAMAIWTYREIAQSSSSPKPEELADRISMATFPAYGSLPLFLVGICLIVVGYMLGRSNK